MSVSRDAVRRAVLRVFCERGGGPLESREILEAVVERLGVGRMLVRGVVGELVREGVLERVPLYGRGRVGLVLRGAPEACGGRGGPGEGQEAG